MSAAAGIIGLAASAGLIFYLSKSGPRKAWSVWAIVALTITGLAALIAVAVGLPQTRVFFEPVGIVSLLLGLGTAVDVGKQIKDEDERQLMEHIKIRVILGSVIVLASVLAWAFWLDSRS